MDNVITITILQCNNNKDGYDKDNNDDNNNKAIAYR